MLTADASLRYHRYQQNLIGRRIALVILSTNAWPAIRDNPERTVGAAPGGPIYASAEATRSAADAVAAGRQ